MGLHTKIAFLAAFISLTNGNFHFEHYKVYKFDGGVEEPYRKPWFFEDYASPSQSGGSGVSEAYEYASEQKSPEVYESPAESHFVSNIKRVPNEDKSFKKAISPFYTLTDSDHDKYKEIVMKSGAPFCQEIKSKVPKKRYRRDAMTCYKCKDPKNGATFEQCSYTSAPQESVRIEERVALPTTLRYRRSNVNGKEENPGAEIRANYRFGDEYFAPAASAEVSAEYKKGMENCEKVVKDSMVCMVCKDPKTNGKYEQCSYTNQPSEKAYGYSKSSSFGNPEGDKKPEESRTQAKPVRESSEKLPSVYPSQHSSEFGGSHPEVDKYIDEQRAAIKSHTPEYKGYDEEPEESARLESGSESAKDGSCKKVVKDTMVCTVCKDPKTGGNYEQCAYGFNPSDKVYQFSRSKTFGYPEEESKTSEVKKSPAEYETPNYNSNNNNGGDNYQGYNQGSENYYNTPAKNSGHKDNYGTAEDRAKYRYDQPTESHESQDYVPFKPSASSNDQVKSKSEEISEDTKASNCEKVQKDTMTCMVCKDPKTGGNYEQCSYAFEPNDKQYSFSKSKSFGSPEAGDKARYTSGNGETAGSSDYGESGGYGLASDNKPYVSSEAVSSAGGGGRKKVEGGKPGAKDLDKVDIGFFSASEKKKEIEKVLSEFEQEDRSKCKKVIRDKLTCFQCADKDGAQKEECIFVAAQEPAKDPSKYREAKEFQRDPVAAAESKIPQNWYSDISPFDDEIAKPLIGKKLHKRKSKKTIPERFYSEPSISASENDERTSDLRDEDSEIRKENDEAETEPYDYAAATKPVYDKVLGLTLPRYMLDTSEHEIEFDEVVASSKI